MSDQNPIGMTSNRHYDLMRVLDRAVADYTSYGFQSLSLAASELWLTLTDAEMEYLKPIFGAKIAKVKR